MPSIYKKGRDKRRYATWYIGYVDHTGKRRTVKGFTDKSLTERLAAKLSDEARARREGLIDPQQENLERWRRAPIEDHLSDFESELRRRRTTAKHVTTTMGRVRKIIKGCGISTLAQMTAEAVERFLGTRLEEPGFGHRTHNHYAQAIEQFGSWLVRRQRVAVNPVTGLHRQNRETDVRRRRRALNEDEFRRLVRAARSSTETIQCYDGETRARIYMMSYMTGLRRGELASLTPASFNLDATPPTLTVEAIDSKHRRRDTLPLHPDLVAVLPDWLRGLASGDRLFPKLVRRRTWLMVKKDLASAGIPYLTAQGVADFHAVGRYSYVTGLLNNGVSPAHAMKLARHADLNTTMGYANLGLADQAEALQALPSPWQQVGDDSTQCTGYPE
jgi:integrase